MRELSKGTGRDGTAMEMIEHVRTHTCIHTDKTFTVGRWKKMGTLGAWDCGENNAVYERHGDQATSENGASHS